MAKAMRMNPKAYLTARLMAEKLPSNTTTPKAPRDRIANKVAILEINLGKHWTKKTHRMPIPKATPKLILIQS